MKPKFLYFDLGKVLVDFSIERMFDQMATVAGVAVEKVRDALFSGRLLADHECGRLTNLQFYDAFCEATGTWPDLHRLAVAATEIFTLKTSMVPLVGQLRQAGCRMGILSNTCEIHWAYCRKHYRIVAEGFDVHALSFEIGAMKPEAAIFAAAAEMAGCRPEEIFFVDDLLGHVEGAQAAGFDAIQFTSAERLAAELRNRGLRFNY